ncbi:unnamed protein product [Caenorhabditis auriculariae]|uniref:Variable lymphocyte receptor C-terminal domain-containing protein n=1 Tax=Caenorhabditis auriculariae TaxID=2777116 RepID=A0A8S1HIR4_9PELO|nr:unnamed protein product [Caenorhabditis auriculariae]
MRGFSAILSLLAFLTALEAYEDFPETYAEMQKVLKDLELELAQMVKDKNDIALQFIDGSGELQNEPVFETSKSSTTTSSSTSTTTTTTTTTTLATTTIPTTTTTKIVKMNICVPEAQCYKDNECGFRTGRCLGSELGTCDCGACVAGRSCSSDSDCGGLRNSCASDTGRCDCVEAFKTHGYELFINVILKFCRQTKCNVKNNDKACFGLPCRVGKCLCD